MALKTVPSLPSPMNVTQLVSSLRIHKDGLSAFVRLSHDGQYVIFSSGSTGTFQTVPITMPLYLVLARVREMFEEIEERRVHVPSVPL